MRAITFTVMLVLTSCREPLDPLEVACTPDLACKYLPDGSLRLLEDGEFSCRPGRLVCKGSRDLDPVCEGYVPCTDEICNNIDDDGLGGVDNMEPVPARCGGLGVCTWGMEYCINGETVCIQNRLPSEETCDGRDEDCDGIVDEDLGPIFFYPEDQYPNTVGVGVCSPGVKRCVDGAWKTVREPTLPARSEEDCQNNLDDNCNGIVDEWDGEPRNDAFSLVIDISGSMDAYLLSVTLALCDWASDPVFDASLFSVTFVGSTPQWTGYDYTDHGVRIWQDFADAATTCASLLGIPYGGAYEFQPMGIYLADRDLGWPEGTDRHVVVFSDEEIQYDADGLVTITDVTSACLIQGFDIGVFTATHWYLDWDPFVSTCGGFRSFLDPNPNDMMADLRYRFAGGCY